MNEIVILSTGLGHVDESAFADPRFRKATRNMLLALTAAEECLSSVAVDPRHLGFVLGSSHGELEMTLSFLKTLAQSGVARPLLFQNSLHNSTAGFVAMTHKISGPLLTVSNLHFSGEDALSTGRSLLLDGLCSFCLVLGVDVRLPDLGPELELNSMNSPLRREGAAAVLLAIREAAEEQGLPYLGQLLAIQNNYRRSENAKPQQPHYDSDAVEHLVCALRSNENPTPLNLTKPDGSSARIEWQR